MPNDKPQTTRHTHLCIGGPLAGKKYMPQEGTRFSVPVFKSDPRFDNTKQGCEPVEVLRTDYREEIIHTPQGDVFFFIPSDQTPLDTLMLLLSTYEKHHEQD